MAKRILNLSAEKPGDEIVCDRDTKTLGLMACRALTAAQAITERVGDLSAMVEAMDHQVDAMGRIVLLERIKKAVTQIVDGGLVEDALGDLSATATELAASLLTMKADAA